MYTNQEKAVKGMKSDSSPFAKVETAAAMETIPFGSAVFTHVGAVERGSRYKLDATQLAGDIDFQADDVITITDSGNVVAVVDFDTDHDTTMDLIVDELEDAGYTVTLTGAPANNRELTVQKDFSDVNIVITTVNPNFAFTTLTGNVDLIADNSTTVTINGVALDPVVYAGSHNATMDLIVARIEAAGYEAILTDIAGNNRTIVIRRDYEDVTATMVTIGALAQPVWAPVVTPAIITAIYGRTRVSTMQFRGIALFTQKEPGGYKRNEAVPVLVVGEVYVDASANGILSLQNAFYVPANDSWTNDDTAGINVFARFQENAENGDLVKIIVAG